MSPSRGSYKGVRDAKNNECHCCGRQRVGELLGAGPQLASGEAGFRAEPATVEGSIPLAGSNPHFVRADGFDHVAADGYIASSRFRFFTPSGLPRCLKIEK